MSEIKKCPKCGGELEKGRMQAAGIVFLNKDDIEEHFTSHWLKEFWLESHAFRCKHCELLTFSYGKDAKRFTR